MSAALTCEVLIVGLGPVGATLAGLLGDQGLEVLAIDKSTEVYPLPRAAHFDHEIMRVFQQLGIAEALGAHARPATGYEFRTAEGQVLLSFDGYGEALAESGWSGGYMFNQPGLEGALRDKLARLPNVQVRLGAEFKSLAETERGVEATVSESQREVVVRARYIVGCDGAWSPVREAVGINLIDLQFDEPWLVIDAIPQAGCRLPEVNLQICDPARPTTCVLMGPGRHRWEFMLLPGETPERVLQDDFIQGLLAPWDVQVDIERKAVYRFHGLVADRWRAGAVLIAGDAAHQTPPFAGQGMCAGVRDAANLAWKLAYVLRGEADTRLLDSYQVEREPNVRAYIEGAISMGRVVCTLDREIARKRDEEMLAARAAGVQAVPPPAPPPLSSFAIMEGTAAAGAVFPQPVVRTGEGLLRLDDVLGWGPWLISRAPLSQPVDQSITVVSLQTAKLAPFSADLEAWLVQQGCEAVLVRPDRCVFGTGTPNLLLTAWGRALGPSAAARAVRR